MTLKGLVQSFIPKSILKEYKKQFHYTRLKDFDLSREPDLIPAIHLLERDKIALDIGANVGVYTLALAKYVKEVISIEPVPFTFDILKSVVRKFNLENVKVLNKAISDKTGNVTISVPEIKGTTNYFRARIVEDQLSKRSTFTVNAITIDDAFLKKADEICFIKVDVEGHELACIQGALGFLEQATPPWLIEITGNPDDPHSPAAELFRLLSSYDYHIFWFDGIHLKLRMDGDSSINYFFLQSGHIEILKRENLIIS